MAHVLAISSMVARGHVGLSATTFPLMRLGHEISALPTVVMAHHPGHAPHPARIDMPDLRSVGNDVLNSPRPHPVDSVLVGYIALPAQVPAITELIAGARFLKPDIPVLVDPVSGDAGRLYVDSRIVSGVGAKLLPLADIITPNVTELAALAAPDRLEEASHWDRTEVIARARTLDVPTVVVTSAPAAAGKQANLIVQPEAVWCVETPHIDVRVNGTGDLLAGLIMAYLLQGESLPEATARSAATVVDILEATRRSDGDELALVTAQEHLARPATKAVLTRI